MSSKTNKREFKGESLLILPNNFTIIDIETTGFDFIYDDLLEISAIKIRNNEIIETYHRMVKTNNEIPEFITELTGITNDMTDDGEPLKIVLNEFINFVEDDILIGHNVNFDINFLYDNIENSCKTYLTNNFIDTMRLAKRMYPELESYSLDYMVQHFSIENEVRHRSTDDCLSTLKLYFKLRECILKKYDNEEEFRKQTQYSGLHAKDIVATIDEKDINKSNPFFKKYCVFTGTLERMQRKEAMQIISNLGGVNEDNVTKKTNYLILGNNEYKSNVKNGITTKMKKAAENKLKGQEIEIISENVFYDVIDDYSQQN